MEIHYTTTGKVRGNCGHRHQSILAAYACQRRDSRQCQRAGGYSDRSVYLVEGGQPRSLTPYDLSAAEALAMGYNTL